MKKTRPRHAYVIGAGFSAGLGYPQTSDLIMQLLNRAIDRRFKDRLCQVMEFHNPGFDEERFNSFPNVEELLSQLMVNEQLFDSSRQYEGTFTKQDLQNLQRDLLLTIAEWFHEISDEITPSESHVPWLKTFRDRVWHEKASIVSFNWDLILDELLFGCDLDETSYGFKTNSTETPVLIKPHGSLNWFDERAGRRINADRKFLLFGRRHGGVYAFRPYRAPVSKMGRIYTPLIVPPVLMKNFDKPVFKALWRRCTRLLSRASRVIFIGYSMPAADHHARFIMRCGFHNQMEGELAKAATRETATGPAEVVIINPDLGAAKRIQAITGSRHKCRWIPSPIADVQWDRL